MTNREIINAFESDHEYFNLSKRKTRSGAYIETKTVSAFSAYKARWIDAFGVKNEREND